MLCAQVVDNFGQVVGRGCRGGGRPELTPHAAPKGPERAGAGTETLRRPAPGATRALVDPSPARGEHVAAADLIVGTAASPRGTMFLGRTCRPLEAHLGAAAMERRGLSPRHVREVDAGEPSEMGPEVKGWCVPWRVPRRGRRWGPGLGGRIDAGRTRAEDALDCLIAVGEVLLGKVSERQRWGTRAKMCRPVIPRERFGHGLGTGCDAVVPRRRSGMGGSRAPAPSARSIRRPVTPVTSRIT